MKVVSPGYAAAMKNAAVWLKVLALSSAVALGGGYVWWSQKKAEDKRVKEAEARERMTLSGSKSAVILGNGEEPVNVEMHTGDGWLGKGWTNADSIQPAPPEEEERTILPGSKSFVLPPAPEKEVPAKPRTMLPSSKRIDSILSPDEAEDEP